MLWNQITQTKRIWTQKKNSRNLQEYREIGGKRGSSLIGDSGTTGDNSNLVKTRSIVFFSIAIVPETSLPVISIIHIAPVQAIPLIWRTDFEHDRWEIIRTGSDQCMESRHGWQISKTKIDRWILIGTMIISGVTLEFFASIYGFLRRTKLRNFKIETRKRVWSWRE